MNTENYYKILGVDENATQDKIKKTYRKLAKENHPDVGGDEEKFKKISEAYDTLGDKDKRAEYDNRRKFGGFGDGMFNGFNGFNPFGRRKQTMVHDTVIDTDLTVIESYLGSEKKITYRRKDKCQPCNGSGGEKKTCNVCNGQGHVVRQMGVGMFVQIIQMACDTCNGVGEILINPCKSCNGHGTKDEVKSVEVKLPQGIDDGQFVRLQGVGDFRNGVYGNLIVRVNLRPVNNFEKLGQHLVYTKFFNLEDLKEDSFVVPHPDGDVSIKFPNIFDTTKPLRLKSKGFKGGDLLVNQQVKFERN